MKIIKSFVVFSLLFFVAESNCMKKNGKVTVEVTKAKSTKSQDAPMSSRKDKHGCTVNKVWDMHGGSITIRNCPDKKK